MFGSIGIYELLIIFTIALLVFGPRKLPELGKSLGKTLQEFRRATNELKHTLDEEVALEEQKVKPATPVPPAALPAPAAMSNPEVPEVEGATGGMEVPVASSLPSDLPSDLPSEPETVARGHQ